jgi:hypothetical protein
MAVHHVDAGMLGAPWQVLVVAVLVVGLFAPQFLPKLGRMLGRTLRSEALRRLGLSSLLSTASSRPVRAPAPRREEFTAGEGAIGPTIEIIAPERPVPSEPLTGMTPIAASHTELPTNSRRRVKRFAPSTWVVSALTLTVAGLIFWFLLHSR